MPENVELTVKQIIITQDYWKNTADCHQTFWSSDNRLSPDLNSADSRLSPDTSFKDKYDHMGGI